MWNFLISSFMEDVDTRQNFDLSHMCQNINFSNLCKAKRSFKANMHPYDSEIENRRVREENIIVIMNISFHHPPIGYFLESYISRSSGKIFPLKWSLVNAQQKKTNKKGQKSEKKGKEKKQKVDIEKAVSLSNKTSWNFSTFPPNFRSCSFAPGTDWSQISFLIVFSLLILLAWKWPENSSTNFIVF